MCNFICERHYMNAENYTELMDTKITHTHTKPSNIYGLPWLTAYDILQCCVLHFFHIGELLYVKIKTLNVPNMG